MNPRKWKHDLPDNLTLDESKGRYRYWHPIKKNRTWLGKDKAKAMQLATDFNLAIELQLQKRRIENGNPYKVKHLVNLFRASAIHNEPWDDGTKRNYEFKLNVINDEYGNHHFVAIDRLEIDKFLTLRCKNADTWNKWRYVFILLYRFAISKKIVEFNEAEAVLKRSTSKKIAYNRTQRIPLTIDRFWKIHDHEETEPFMKVAMKFSLVTLQSRFECVSVKYTDERDGFIYIIRDKTSGDSDMAFIRIEVTDQIKEIIGESRNDNVVTPYIVHRKPKSRQRRHIDNKPHWTYVEPDFITKEFRRVMLLACPEYKNTGRQCPTFHQIRKLGANLYYDGGYTKDQVRSLMTHTDEKTTQIYLTTGQVPDNRFIKVKASLKLSDFRT